MSCNLALVIEYLGTNFHGWQVQPGLRTVQGEMEKIFATVFRQQIKTVYASGRTDSGVHAKAQVCSVELESRPTDLRVIAKSIGSMLKNEVMVKGVAILPEDFNPRRSAKSKQYEYVILNQDVPPAFDAGRAYWTPRRLNIDAMREAASLLLGEHDFKSFQGATDADIKTIRTITRSEFVIDGKYLRYTVEGSGFLKQMVRNIVGTLVQVGVGKRAVSSIPELIAAKDRKLAGPTAPPHALYLNWVQYKEFRSDNPWGDFERLNDGDTVKL